MQINLGVRFYARSDNEWTELRDDPDKREELTRSLVAQVRANLEEAAISTPAGVALTLDGVWEDDKVLLQVRKILRTPDGVSITEHAQELMKRVRP